MIRRFKQYLRVSTGKYELQVNAVINNFKLKKVARGILLIDCNYAI
jgi:hypothetical protein